MGYFLDDSGNFENFVKIWSRRPPDYHQNASTNTRKIMESSRKHIIFVNLGHQKFRKFSKSVCPRYQICFVFSPIFFVFFFDFVLNFLYFLVYILKIILRRWGIENYTFSITKQHPNLNMNFISFKKHEMQITLNFLILKDGTLNFLILKKGTHPTLISR